MAEPHHVSESNGKGLSLLMERAKEEIEGLLLHGKETLGFRNDIDENTPLDDDVKAPNVFERAKEEIEALVQTIHSKRDQSTTAEPHLEKAAENDVKAPNLIERAKEEIEAILHHAKSSHHHHDKETHGRREDIDENTSIDEVRAPNIFERAKEEVEALVQTIHPKKESSENESITFASPPRKEGFAASLGRGLEKVCSSDKDGFKASIGKGFEKVCAPWGSKRD